MKILSLIFLVFFKQLIYIYIVFIFLQSVLPGEHIDAVWLQTVSEHINASIDEATTNISRQQLELDRCKVSHVLWLASLLINFFSLWYIVEFLLFAFFFYLSLLFRKLIFLFILNDRLDKGILFEMEKISCVFTFQ